MKTGKLTNRFWTVLTGVNLFVVLLALGVVAAAETEYARVVAVLVLVGVVLLLAVTDAISIVVAHEL